MEFVILYWHWIVLGLGLMALEIVLPSFVALWFGAAAVVVGGIVLIFPDSPLAMQVLCWVVISILLTWLWFKFMQPLARDRTKAGLSREAMIGETGQVLTPPTSERRGTLRFSVPVLGADEWMFICNDEVEAGDRVRVRDISGNSLIVDKV
ncbi:MAG: hypothetical protein CSB47_09140 [Proteobacteria bacterium]|nr:MAG: hypothetical protein CSB47_09140 [Pseudomonadota bacterium]